LNGIYDKLIWNQIVINTFMKTSVDFYEDRYKKPKIRNIAKDVLKKDFTQISNLSKTCSLNINFRILQLKGTVNEENY